MASEPDYVFELSGRRYALVNLGVGAAVIGFFAVSFTILGAWEAREFQWGMLVVGVLGTAHFGYVFGPLAVRGGTYRITIGGGRLRVESPHWVFCRSFEVPLSEVSEVAKLGVSDGPLRHEIRTRDGGKYCLDDRSPGRRYLPADELFAAIQRLRPEIPLVTEP